MTSQKAAAKETKGKMAQIIQTLSVEFYIPWGLYEEERPHALDSGCIQ